MNKKIGILNFHYSTHNYGAVLQAASIYHIVKNMGYDVEQLNYIPKNKIFSIYSLRKFLGEVKQYIFEEKNHDLSRIKGNNIFDEFRKEWLNINVSDIILKNKNDLVVASDNLDAVIVGSDQVWRPSMTQDSALIYFLNFVNERTRRISYAASFGVDYWKPGLIPFMTKLVSQELMRFDAVSVREESGVKICQDYFRIPAKHVIDPTLLIGVDFFNKIIESEDLDIISSGLCFYKIDQGDKFLEMIDSLSNKLKFDTTNIYYNKENGFLSVPSWLNSIKKSSLIITDSFHCVCFSILFNRPFVYWPNEGRGMSRLQSLLRQVGLEYLICSNEIDIYEKARLAFDIDFPLVNKKLEVLRSSSFDFIKESLEM